MKQRVNGHALSEYGIILALVAVGAIGALTMLGVSLTGALGSLNGGLNNMSQAQQRLASAPAANAPGPAAATSAAESASGGSGATIQVNGQTITLPAISPAVTATSGGNGSQETLAYTSALDNLAQQLEAKGADPALVGLISQLANAGHSLANNQNTVEELCPPGTECFSTIGDAVISGKVTEATSDLNGDGKIDYSDTMVANQKAYEQFQASVASIGSNKATFEEKLQALQSYLAANPGAYPPELASYVNEQSGKILTIAQQYQPNTTNSYIDVGMGAYIPQGSVNLSASVKNGASQTQGASNNVCASGGSNCTQSGFSTPGG